MDKQALRCENLEFLINEISKIEQYKTGSFIKFLYDNGIMIDTVKNKTNVKDIQMYDIGVCPDNYCDKLPDGHDFIAGGFVNHNSQGSTLDCALVDIGSNTFEFGQAYVALSRVKDLDSLYIHDLSPSAFKAHEKVKTFYESSNH